MPISSRVVELESLLLSCFSVASLLSRSTESLSAWRVLIGELGWLILPLAMISPEDAMTGSCRVCGVDTGSLRREAKETGNDMLHDNECGA